MKQFSSPAIVAIASELCSGCDSFKGTVMPEDDLAEACLLTGFRIDESR